MIYKGLDSSGIAVQAKLSTVGELLSGRAFHQTAHACYRKPDRQQSLSPEGEVIVVASTLC